MPSDACCVIGADPARYIIEQQYLTGERIMRYSRQQVERHLSHSVDQKSLREVTDLAGAAAIASRLRQLELTAARIMDAALSEREVTLPDGTKITQLPDGKLALQALREARSTLAEMAKLSDTLSRAGEKSEENLALDDALWTALGMDAPPRPASDGDENESPGERAQREWYEQHGLPSPRGVLES